MPRLQLIVSIASLAITLSTAPCAWADDRTAEVILEDIKSIERPKYDGAKREDKDYVAQFRETMAKADAREADLILELYTAHPGNEKAQELLPRRWNILMHDPANEVTMLKEIDGTVAASTTSDKLRSEAQFLKASTITRKNIFGESKDIDKAMQAVEGFITAYPTDDRAVRLLGMVADAQESGSTKQIALYERILKDYPESGGAKYAKGKIRRAQGLGKPFELVFQDAIHGETVDVKSMKGKVVVVDFWATWCGPCVASMPHLKETYAKHHDAGVEFIGVSLDQPEEKGGLDKLKKFVADKEIPWAQYYQGNFWDSEFSKSWGVNSIPCLFIVDKKGNLRSTDAHDKLDELIPELLAEKD